MEKMVLSDCEQMVMKSVWAATQEIGVQEITEYVNQKYQKTWKLQTVSTFLSRLVKKGYLEMYRKGRTFFYKPLVNEREYRKWIMMEYINFWSAGNVLDFVCGLCEDVTLTSEEKQQIKDIIDRLA